MRAAAGLLLLLLGLCGSGARGEGGDLGEVGEIREFQRRDPRDTAQESTEQTTKQTSCDAWAEVRELRDMVVELRVELRNMEARVKHSESQVDDLKAEVTVTKVHVELLQKENAAQTAELKSLETRLTATESKTRDLEKENADLQSRLSSSESELLISKSKIDQLERENAEKPKVAFYAGLTNAGQVGPFNTDITLKFSKVFTNVGKAYNPSTGFFTAPVKGVYHLQFTLFGHQAGVLGVNVYKNDQKIMYNWETNQEVSTEYITKSIILELIAGDEIHLDLRSGQGVHDDGNNYSTFSGSLLFPL